MKKETDWEFHIKAYLSNGVSVRSYCQSVGLKPHQFRYRYKLYRKQQKPAEKQQGNHGFVPVSVSTSSRMNDPVKLVFPNGCVCWIPVSFNDKSFVQLIRALST